ncbi:MAG: SDR family NAD(P)-dependent oxidoreductase [Acidimicrobiia bacterium]
MSTLTTPHEKAETRVQRSGSTPATKEDQVVDLADSLILQGLACSILVNTMGTIRRGEQIESLALDQWSELIDSNLTSVMLVTKHLLPLLISHSSSSIVNVASAMALVGASGALSYTAAKGGVVSLTRALAVQYARQGVRVNCVCPGLVDTNMARADRLDFDQIRADLIASYPMQRIGTPEEVADLIVFLASDASSWMTGSIISVDGGLTSQ